MFIVHFGTFLAVIVMLIMAHDRRKIVRFEVTQNLDRCREIDNSEFVFNVAFSITLNPVRMYSKMRNTNALCRMWIPHLALEESTTETDQLKSCTAPRGACFGSWDFRFSQNASSS